MNEVMDLVLYGENPQGEGTTLGFWNGMLQLHSKSDTSVTFIGAGFIKLINTDNDTLSEIEITVKDGKPKIKFNGKALTIGEDECHE